MVEVVSRVEKVEFSGNDKYPEASYLAVTLLVEAQSLDEIENVLPALVAGQKLTFQVSLVSDKGGLIYEVKGG